MHFEESNIGSLQNRFLKSIPLGFTQVGLSGRVNYVNKSIFEWFQIRKGSLEFPCYEPIHYGLYDEHRNPKRRKEHSIFKGLDNSVQLYATQMPQIIHKWKCFFVNTSPFYDEYHQCAGAESNFIAIVDKRKADKHPLGSGKKYKKLIGKASDAMNAFIEEFLLVSANSKTGNVTGIPVGQPVGMFSALKLVS